MPRVTYVACLESLPAKTGVLQSHHAELVLELIVQRANSNEEECERLYAELEAVEAMIAAIEAETLVLKRGL